MTKYEYKGQVVQFGRVVKEYWIAQTVAPSKQKAISNLIYQFKKQNNLIQGSKIELDAKKIREVPVRRRY